MSSTRNIGAPEGGAVPAGSTGAQSRHTVPQRQGTAHMTFLAALVAIVAALGIIGCHSDMYDQHRNKPLAPSTFFANGQASRPLEEGTVAHTAGPTDELLTTGRVNGQVANLFPFPVTDEIVTRGQERYNIFCSPCHGRLGDGRGMIVQRGFPAPPSFHTDSLRQRPVGHFVDVITHGFGRMYPYGDRVPPRDRWAIAAYIRALQLSQNVAAGRLPADTQRALTSQ